MVEFREFLRDYMDAYKLSKNSMAQRLGVNPDTLSNWLGNHSSPHFKIAQDALDRLGYELVLRKKNE